MGKSPYPAHRVPVDRTPAMPGAPRERRVRPLDERTLRRVALTEARENGAVRTGVNAGTGSVWGARVAPVTGRKSRKSPGWAPIIAGGARIESPGV